MSSVDSSRLFYGFLLGSSKSPSETPTAVLYEIQELDPGLGLGISLRTPGTAEGFTEEPLKE